MGQEGQLELYLGYLSDHVLTGEPQLRAGSTAGYRGRLVIGNEPPAHAETATSTSSRLVTTVDVAGARDITARRPVKVS